MEDDGYGSIMAWLSRPGSLDFPLLAGGDHVGSVLLDRGGRRGGTVGLGEPARGDRRLRVLELLNQLRRQGVAGSSAVASLNCPTAASANSCVR